MINLLKNKKKINLGKIFFLAGLALFLPILVKAELYNPISSVTSGDTADKMLVNLVSNFLNIIYGMVVGLALIFIVIGGIRYMLATGREKEIEAAKRMIIYAVMGLAVAIGTAVFVKQIAVTLGGETFLGDFTGSSTLLTGVGDANSLLEKVINLLLTSLAALGIIGILIGGFWYLNAGGDQEKMMVGKKTLIYSIIGLCISIVSLIIVKQIANLFGQ
jgi:hypothetical protein